MLSWALFKKGLSYLNPYNYVYKSENNKYKPILPVINNIQSENQSQTSLQSRQ